MKQNFTRIAFTESVKAVQQEHGSREIYRKVEGQMDQFQLGDSEKQFIQTRDSFYLATVGENEWPYVQHRGGPKGFLKVWNDESLVMADYQGNRQYISIGNIQANPKAMLFLIDYPTQQRLKIWATVQSIPMVQHAKVLSLFESDEHPSKIERMLRFKIQAFDWNCPRYITPRYSLEEIDELRL